MYIDRYLVSDASEPRVVKVARVARDARDDYLRTEEQRVLLQALVVDQARVGVHLELVLSLRSLTPTRLKVRDRSRFRESKLYSEETAKAHSISARLLSILREKN